MGAAGRFRREAALYFSAQEFLTRLPVPGWTGHEPDRLARASRYFPLVGLLVGGVAAVVWLVGGALAPPPLAAGLALAAMLFVTGALHEDGLADCCDGLGGARRRERALEIMRDSRIGVYGAAGLVLTLGLRWAALAGMDPALGAFALVAAAASGRAAITVMLGLGVYARTDGAAAGVAGGARGPEVALAIAIALTAGLAAGWAAAGRPGALAAAAALAAALFMGRLWLAWLTRRLGGYTGDGLGAAEQIGQIVVFLTLAGALS